PAVDGLTFSGGEPMAQAAGLAQVARSARRRRDVSVLCFTGYRLEQLTKHPPAPGVADPLAEIGVLIDDWYVAARGDGRGMRGSDNQRVHHLSGRLADHDFDRGPRHAEIRVTEQEALLIGVPPLGFAAIFDTAVDAARDAAGATLTVEERA